MATDELSLGYIVLYRVLLRKPIWKLSTPEQKVILITLLLMANYEEAEWEWQGKKFKVMPGQFISSLENIAKACGKGISIQNVRSALLKFEKLEFLTNTSTKTGRLITVLNWQHYQIELRRTNKDSNKEVTNDQQSTNKEVTTNNNNKKDKKDKNVSDPKVRYADFVLMTPEEYQKLIEKFGEVITKDKIDALNLWKGSKGKKTNSDYLTILNWDRREKNGATQRPTATSGKQPSESVKRYNSKPL